MQYINCDLCGLPVKEIDYYTLSIIGNHEKNKIKDTNGYYRYLDKITKEIKDICPTCKLVIDEIFKLRRNNLHLISQDLLGIYELPPKEKK